MAEDLEVYCPECGKLFKGEQRLLEHLEKERSEKYPNHYGTHHCPKCGAEFYFKSVDGFKSSMNKPFLRCRNCSAAYKISPGLDGKTATISLVEESSIAEGEVKKLQDKMNEIAGLYADGKIGQDTYLTTSSAIENKIEQYKSAEAKENSQKYKPDSSPYTSVNKTKMRNQRHSAIWYLAPLFLGLLGGLIGYIVVKDDDKPMANNLILFGVLMTIVIIIFSWVLYFWFLFHIF